MGSADRARSSRASAAPTTGAKGLTQSGAQKSPRTDATREREVACATRVGSTLKSTWKLERMIGVGGMAAVYAASRIEGSASAGAAGVERPERAAVKVLHPEIARSKELTKRFQQEALAARIGHPGAVMVVETDVGDDGCPFLVMELLEGESLLERMTRSSDIDLHELLGHVVELLDVLGAAHAKGIVHRDIKLDNLFLPRGGGLKVLDFGIARVKSSSITVTGQRLGTVAYMPPEQMRGLEVDGRADLFAVGATLFRVIAKRRVHVADNDGSLLMKMANDPAPPLRSVAPNAHVGLAAVVDRALAYFARERYPDARTMQDDVRALLAGNDPPFASKLLAKPPTGPSSRGSASGSRQPSANEAFADAPTVVPGASREAETHAAGDFALEPTALAGVEDVSSSSSARAAATPGLGTAKPWQVGAQRGRAPRPFVTLWVAIAVVVFLGLASALGFAFLR